MCRKLTVGHHGEHGVGEILHHERHAVRLGPRRRQKRSGEGLAGFERDSVPPQLTACFDHAPVVGTFIEEKRFSRSDGCRGDGVFVQFVGERLFNVEEASVGAGSVHAQAIKNIRHVGGFMHAAVKVRAQPVDVVFLRHFADPNQAFVIPCGVCSSEFDLQRLETVGANPVVEEYRHAVVWLGADGVVFGQRIEATNQMPDEESVLPLGQEIVRYQAALQLLRRGRCIDEGLQSVGKCFFVEQREHGAVEELADGVVKG